jgi:opacity protein-like surface antigen
MIRIFYIGIVILISVTGALEAQEQSKTVDGTNKALIFSFSGLTNLNLNSYEGGIGAKFFSEPNMAFRGGLQFANAGASIPANPPAGQTGKEGSQSAIQIGVSAAIEIHFSLSRISPYLGGGLGMMFTSTESKNAVFGNTVQTTTKNNRNGESISGTTYFGGTTYRFFGMGGMEYFVSQNLSLSAEYRIGYSTTARYKEELITGNTTISSDLGRTFSLGFSTGGSLAIAVYF